MTFRPRISFIGKVDVQEFIFEHLVIVIVPVVALVLGSILRPFFAEVSSCNLKGHVNMAVGTVPVRPLSAFRTVVELSTDLVADVVVLL